MSWTPPMEKCFNWEFIFNNNLTLRVFLLKQVSLCWKSKNPNRIKNSAVHRGILRWIPGEDVDVFRIFLCIKVIHLTGVSFTTSEHAFFHLRRFHTWMAVTYSVIILHPMSLSQCVMLQVFTLWNRAGI